MTEGNSIHDFSREVNCTYKEEQYSVRDNGAVLRYPCVGKRPRPTDNKWTFGKKNETTGYMEIATARVHIIIATAFYGEKSTKVYVVDHIDTNRSNNRVENLRWLTRFEHAVKNEISRKKIEYVCGCSIEEFLADPAKYRDRFQEPNFQWMRTVTAEEAKVCLENMKHWAKSDKLPSGGSLGEWVYTHRTWLNQDNKIPEIIKSKTLNAVQRYWKIPSEFPCCPNELTDDPIASYAENLKKDSIFCRNDFYSALVFKSAISDDRQCICVITENKDAEKPWAVAKITFENNLFVHTGFGQFFLLQHAVQYFAQNLEQGYTHNIGQDQSYESTNDIPEFTESKTTNAVQRDWKTPSEFPCCPQESTEPISDYAERLKEGSVFCRNDVYSSVVSKSAISEDRQSIYVLTENPEEDAIKGWALAKITHEKNLFVHESLGTFFTQEGAEKQYCLAQGLEWLGGDSIDDYC